MSNKGKKIKVIWNDAKLFFPKNEDAELSIMETVGFIEAEYGGYLVIKDPKTKNTKTGKNHPDNQPTFYFIPTALILEKTLL